MQMRWTWKLPLGGEVSAGQGGLFMPHQGLQEPSADKVERGFVFQSLWKEAVLGLHHLM